MSLSFNEGKCCDAVLKVIEARENAKRNRVSFPERDRHKHPIELACHVGGRLYALEHTGIEPFAGHMQMEAEASWRIDPIREQVAGKLPSGNSFELHMAADALQNMMGQQLIDVQRALAEWVVSRAPTVPLARYAEYLSSVQPVRPPSVPFGVRLYRFKSEIPIDLFLIRHVVADTELWRAARIKAACEKKFPKLDSWRRGEGARAVLVLENNDNLLTNPEGVFRALASAESELAQRPDEVYVVGTFIECPWFVWALRVDDQGYYELSKTGNNCVEYDSSKLCDITGGNRRRTLVPTPPSRSATS